MADEVCSIIKACGVANVTELKFGDLYLRLGHATPAETQGLPRSPLAHDGQIAPAPTPPPAAEIAEPIPKISAELQALSDEIETRQEQLAQMFIEDPVQAEHLLMSGDLTDDGATEEA